MTDTLLDYCCATLAPFTTCLSCTINQPGLHPAPTLSLCIAPPLSVLQRRLSSPDSPSSRTSLSRPTTPPDSTVHVSTRFRSATSSSPPTDHFTLAVKAERVLGLTPGTLAHARACLENARDEVRRLSQERSPPPVDFATYQSSFSDGGKDKGLKGRFDRAKKVMSVALPSHARMPSVVVGTGGKEEEERREMRRRAVDGVIHWQKMVENLEKEQAASKQSTRRR